MIMGLLCTEKSASQASTSASCISLIANGAQSSHLLDEERCQHNER
jgi:hypothetical protein